MSFFEKFWIFLTGAFDLMFESSEPEANVEAQTSSEVEFIGREGIQNSMGIDMSRES